MACGVLGVAALCDRGADEIHFSTHRSMRYRPEIDGLRALAVVPVVLFHAGFPLFKGGFVGVDVFFVISGYLITSIIIAEVDEGKFSIARFYERRMRRILPALFLVAGISILAAWWWLPPPKMRALAESAGWMAAFSSNVYFWLNAGYFDTATQLNPLLHTWTLSVEEQFYILFPPAIVFIWRFGRRWAASILGLVALSSLLLAQWQSSAQPSAAFYLLPARSWELMIGALTAIHINTTGWWRLSAATASAATGLGLALILLAIVQLDEKTPYPSAYTLIPTLGAALIILYCRTGSMVGQMLSHPVLVKLGLISYSVYLWHHPLFAFYRIKSGSSVIDLRPALGLIAATLVLSYATWMYVEQPWRKRTANRGRVFAVSALAMTSLVAVGYAGIRTDGFSSRFTREQAEFVAFFKNERPEQEYFKRIQFREKFRDECNFYDIESDLRGHPTNVPRRSIARHCVHRSSPEIKAVFVWGDSHARQLSHGLIESLPNGWEVLQVTSHGCPASTSAAENKSNYCEYSNWFALQSIKRERPEVVIVGQNLGHDVNRMKSIGNHLHQSGVKKVIFTGPTPHWLSDFADIVAYNIIPRKDRRTSVGLDRSIVAMDVTIKKDFPQSEGLKYVSLIDKLCNADGCIVYFGDDMKSGLTSWDYGHLTPIASLEVGRSLAPIVLD